MRASLASATSLIALLLLQEEAGADPYLRTGVPTPFYYVLNRNWDAGITGNPGETHALASPTTPWRIGGQGGLVPYFELGQSVLSKLAGSASANGEASPWTVRGTSVPAGAPGDGATVNGGTASGATGSGNSVFVGTVSILLPLNTPVISASASFGYTIPSPAKSDADEAAMVSGELSATDPSVPASLGDTPAQTETQAPSLPDPGSGTVSNTTDGNVSYTYTPLGLGVAKTPRPPGGAGLSPTSTSTPKGAALDRPFPGSVPGGSVFNGRQPAGDRGGSPIAPRIITSPANQPAASAFARILQRLNLQTHAGAPVLTARGCGAREADPSVFAISSALTGPDAVKPAAARLPILVVGSGSGELPSSLMIFTPESTTSDGAGDSLSYFFNPGVVQ